MIPRAVWWAFFGIALLDFAWNTWACFFDRPHWHRDVAAVDLLTIALAAHRLAYPLKTKGDDAT
jgi:hypothetical protein